MNKLNERIKKRRKEEGLTQAFVANALGVSQAAVAKWEQGDVSPRGENFEKLSSVIKLLIQIGY